MAFCFNSVEYKLDETVNRFLLVGDIYNKEIIQDLYRQEIQIISTKMVFIKLVFNMIWLMLNIKI